MRIESKLRITFCGRRFPFLARVKLNFIGLVSCVIAQGNINRQQLSCSLMLWRESLESSLTQLEQEEFVVEVSLRKKPFDLSVFVLLSSPSELVTSPLPFHLHRSITHSQYNRHTLFSSHKIIPSSSSHILLLSFFLLCSSLYLLIHTMNSTILVYTHQTTYTHLEVLETRTNEWSGRLQTLLDSLISLQTHLLPGSAVVEREDGGEGQLSQSEKTHPSYLIPHLLGSLEKGMVLLRLTVDSKV